MWSILYGGRDNFLSEVQAMITAFWFIWAVLLMAAALADYNESKRK